MRLESYPELGGYVTNLLTVDPVCMSGNCYDIIEKTGSVFNDHLSQHLAMKIV